MLARDSGLSSGWHFFGRYWWHIVRISAVLILPCFWQRHIEAGDLGSHLYNAWLGQLIEKGQAPGLYFARQFSNVLFDCSLLRISSIFGFWVAEKVAVSLCVLIFFWGLFALVSAVADDAQWLLMPCIAILAYGYAFNMGFMNYYVSLGLAAFALSLVWPMKASERREADWIGAALILIVGWLAHPIGPLWAFATIAYVALRNQLDGWRKLAVPGGAIILLLAFRWYLHHRVDLAADFNSGLPFWQSTGADQLMVYGDFYETLAWLALAFGVACLLIEVVRNLRNGWWWQDMALPVELYLVAFIAVATFPENFRVSMYAAWIGLLVSRLTAICAILGLAVLGRAQLRQWTIGGFAIIATAYFVLLGIDTHSIGKLEASAEAILRTVPAETRIIPTLRADPDWRVEFVSHVADRACIRHCFVYSNYEPPSKQFRVRVSNGATFIVTDSAEDADDMQGGSYEIDRKDLPVTQLYQCDPTDWTKLCIHDLKEGENTGTLGYPRH
ncbi:MAG: hypothetical protein JO119_10470 [Acidobacteria bacterium]|nr:hypothetical protein [Acidobacteriota bacterium]